ncbi:response regulator [Pseudooceanicola sp.]|uniref:response regulator n=1 Tax=Pseudooceanicola sp. TaxID=1914328 RepID=UPI002614434D|nr:response regulator [Pseudooceanicola sp.]MDF1855253.1 response regulator [Pseudooceanicola sp.]
METAQKLHQAPSADRPLLGLTVLVVEDSRFASEAMRLLCLRSGARIRRADCLRSAHRHLQVYRPSVVIVDLGLPDGSGADLITELTSAMPRVSVVLGLSGDDGAKARALGAGADGFIAKPVESLAQFHTALLRHLPPDRQVAQQRPVTQDMVHPDRIAFRDDMAHLAEVLSKNLEDTTLDYLAQFLGGLARSARDQELISAAVALAMSRKEGRATRSDVARIAGLVQERLTDRAAI